MPKKFLAAAAIAPFLCALAKLPFQAQSLSTVSYSVKGDEESVEIRNVAWQYTGTRVPGRPPDERLLLRSTAHTANFIGDIPEPGALTLEAWPLGINPKQQPLYSVTLQAAEARQLDNCLWLIDRGYVDMPMWSIHRLADGRHLFDTHVDLVRFTVSRADGTPRYAGLDVPADDNPDSRLKDPHVVAVLIYAGEDRVIREALITHDKPLSARQLRSQADETRQLSFTGHAVTSPRDRIQPKLPGRARDSRSRNPPARRRPRSRPRPASSRPPYHIVAEIVPPGFRCFESAFICVHRRLLLLRLPAYGK